MAGGIYIYCKCMDCLGLETKVPPWTVCECYRCEKKGSCINFNSCKVKLPAESDR